MAERVFWPFKPNWASSYRVGYQFMTDIFESDSGLEQRRALRITPRKTIGATYTIDGTEFASFKRFLFTSQNLPVIMPEITRSVRSTVTMSTGSVIAVDSVPAWLTAGAEVVLSHPSASALVAAVQSVSGLNVTFTSNRGIWPGGTVLTYAVTGSLAQEMTMRLLTTNVAETEVSLRVDPGSEAQLEGSAATAWNGYEVCGLKPNWATQVDFQSLWPIVEVDSGYGIVTPYRPIDFHTSITAFDVLFPTVADAHLYVEFICRMHGQQGQFWLSSWQPDMIPSQSLVAGQSALQVKGEDIYLGFGEDPVRNCICITLSDGSTLFRQIVDVGLPYAGYSSIVVDEPWPASVPLDQISTISWLINSRFATDDFEIEWLTDSVAQTRVSIKSLPSPSAVAAANVRATLEGDDRETLAGDDREVIYL